MIFTVLFAMAIWRRKGVLLILELLRELVRFISIRTYLESAAPWSDGQIYNAIAMGSASGIMLGLKDKLTPRERWAIVLYLRALQSYVSDATNRMIRNHE